MFWPLLYVCMYVMNFVIRECDNLKRKY